MVSKAIQTRLRADLVEVYGAKLDIPEFSQIKSFVGKTDDDQVRRSQIAMFLEAVIKPGISFEILLKELKLILATVLSTGWFLDTPLKGYNDKLDALDKQYNELLGKEIETTEELINVKQGSSLKTSHDFYQLCYKQAAKELLLEKARFAGTESVSVTQTEREEKEIHLMASRQYFSALNNDRKMQVSPAQLDILEQQIKLLKIELAAEHRKPLEETMYALQGIEQTKMQELSQALEQARTANSLNSLTQQGSGVSRGKKGKAARARAARDKAAAANQSTATPKSGPKN